MKKFTKLLAIMVSIIFILAACGNGDDPFDIPSLSSFSPKNAPDMDFGEGAPFMNIDQAMIAFDVFDGLLGKKCVILEEILGDLIVDELFTSSQSDSVSLNLSAYKDDKDITDNGIINLAGKVTASYGGTEEESSGSFSASGGFNYSHDYNSKEDSFPYLPGDIKLPSDTDIKAKVKVINNSKSSSNWTETSWTGIFEEAIAMAYVVSYNSANTCGIGVVNLGLASIVKWTQNDEHSGGTYISGPIAKVDIKFYDKDGTYLFGKFLSGTEALDFFGYYDYPDEAEQGMRKSLSVRAAR